MCVLFRFFFFSPCLFRVQCWRDANRARAVCVRPFAPIELMVVVMGEGATVVSEKVKNDTIFVCVSFTHFLCFILTIPKRDTLLFFIFFSQQQCVKQQKKKKFFFTLRSLSLSLYLVLLHRKALKRKSARSRIVCRML